MIIDKPEERKSSESKEVTEAPLKKKMSDQDCLRKVFSPMSINAIFFASILLSSRLNSNGKVFTLLFVSLCIFGFLPIIRHLTRHRVRVFYEICAIISSLCLFYRILQVNRFFGILYAFLIIFISFISPLIFIYAYTFKNDIRGPWDCPNIKQYHSL